MCDFKILIKTNDGYAAHCSGCNHLEIVFGTSAIRFHLNHLCHFINYLNKIKEQQSWFNNDTKNILLDIASLDSFQMILTYNELACLVDMVEKIKVEVKVNAMPELFSKQ